MAVQCCCTSPRTGFYRNGFCQTGPSDHGKHVVCARVTKEWLEFSRSRGNDLMTPRPPSFPGLKPGDRCASPSRLLPLRLCCSRSRNLVQRCAQQVLCRKAKHILGASAGGAAGWLSAFAWQATYGSAQGCQTSQGTPGRPRALSKHRSNLPPPMRCRWCLCVSRWKEALDAGLAPPVYLDGCHQNALQLVTLEDLQAHALQGAEAFEGGCDEPDQGECPAAS